MNRMLPKNRRSPTRPQVIRSWRPFPCISTRKASKSCTSKRVASPTSSKVSTTNISNPPIPPSRGIIMRPSRWSDRTRACCIPSRRSPRVTRPNRHKNRRTKRSCATILTKKRPSPRKRSARVSLSSSVYWALSSHPALPRRLKTSRCARWTTTVMKMCSTYLRPPVKISNTSSPICCWRCSSVSPCSV